MRLDNVPMATQMRELAVEETDWESFSAEDAKRLVMLTLACRRFEETILQLDKLGLVHGPAHSSIGQDGAAAGCLAALPNGTKINGTHRSHHNCMSKLLSALYYKDFDPVAVNRMPEDMRREVFAMMSEVLGLRTGWNGGRGGSMHMRKDELGIMGTDAIVAGGMPLAVGVAFADKVRKADTITVTFFGDGAIHQGTAHEAMNLAALYSLPMIFFLENNHYAVSMSVGQSTRETTLLTRPVAHGIAAVRVDGMNPFAVWLATRWAEEHIRENGGPAFIEADVYRYYHQSRPFPGSAFGYRTKDEESEWRARDPIDFLRRELPARGILSAADIDGIDAMVKEAMAWANAEIVEGLGSSTRIREELWPDASDPDAGLVGDLSEFDGVSFTEVEDHRAEDMVEMSLIEAMPRVMGANMAKDDTIYVFGEDVANMNGGTVGATRGLVAQFPDRIINTPITENGFCGLANGAATSGLKPVIELMYSDFALVAADQLFNHSAKIRHLFNGKHSVPLVLRCRIPGTEGYGSQHSMDPSGIFALYPGWRVVAASNAFDYVGLMNTALRCTDPVLVIEHQGLYNRKGPIPKNFDHFIPIGKAKRVAEGNQITLLTTLALVDPCIEVAREMGCSADIIDLRTLSLRDIDYETIGASIRKTGNVAIVEQTTRGTSLGSHIADEIQRRFFDYLDQPVKRVTGGWAAPTVSKVLERAALAGPEDIRDVIASLLHDSGQPLLDKIA
ncbi:alpha-ketoacid dehydrogenase subunit alpha/beta [Rhizobium rhizogenes]|uniref:2-oxoglutarate dehydrogenase E1 component n=1 Tax=Rhizobium rhizogenes NBRC 13257 TaxID=1220581 RepID=A0AA87QB50_RHIRH|nr:alpha-ketoacid dehydrogenase subunit alpha/beta [Rhizobium rhizogenes]NTG63355.1 2-oxoisovalerate dehydrogenase [Rhizobium rhizogenes]NTG69938.1 2-oxoisovalerate dehydrogenase [Rhizobium rhizogenes]NTG82816.1 2-oxoisovalerate dehydrogenase [Rhizobium rhizogenes]NTH28175.1 2-oxoisovalerate dehydrogenase [Rhizobium rhizogenes]NTH53738.1 2-oxoisovalerate dehydrogenase [Rhizobium rhizogenes]